MVLVWMNKEAEKFYDDKWKTRGDLKTFGPSSRHTRELILRYADKIEFKSVIDIGCGDGTLLYEMTQRYNLERICGIDLSQEAINITQQRLEGKFFVLDIAKEKIDDKFDLCICSEVLEHIDDDIKAINNIRDLCEKFILTVPSGKYGLDDEQAGHVRRYSRSDLENKLREAGFKIINIRNWGFPFYSPLYRWALRRTKDEARSGEFGIGKKLISYSIYYLFNLNLIDQGDRIIALAI